MPTHCSAAALGPVLERGFGRSGARKRVHGPWGEEPHRPLISRATERRRRHRQVANLDDFRTPALDIVELAMRIAETIHRGHEMKRSRLNE